MSVLRICLFGRLRLARDDDGVEIKVTRTVQGLLAFLLLERHRTHPREILVDLFWRDHPFQQANNCLNTALWRLRRVLEPAGVERGAYVATTPTGEVGFNDQSTYWLDVAVFEGHLEQALAIPPAIATLDNVSGLEHALSLYTGDLLEGFYDSWALHERERLRNLRLRGLAYLMRYYHSQGEFETSIAYGQRILDDDPIREEIHRDLMRIHAESGQRSLAVRQYEVCRDVLAAELGIAPMPETQRLYAQIAASGSALTSPGPLAPLAGPTMVGHLHLALRQLEQTRQLIQQMLQLMETGQSADSR